MIMHFCSTVGHVAEDSLQKAKVITCKGGTKIAPPGFRGIGGNQGTAL